MRDLNVLQGGEGWRVPNAPRAPCVIGKYCNFHGGVHGREAETLRRRFEHLQKHLDRGGKLLRSSIQYHLDSIDALDSLAYLEAKERKKQGKKA